MGNDTLIRHARVFVWENRFGIELRGQVDFIPADDTWCMLEKIFDNKNSAEGMDRVEDRDIDRQTENEPEES